MRRAHVGYILAFLSVHPLTAQESPADASASHAASAPRAMVVRTTSSIRVDGVPDEAAWQAAPAIDAFTQYDPSEGSPVSERTEVRFLYDGDALYVGAWLYDRDEARARLGRRDMSMSASDWLTVIVDSHHDHRTAYGFEINPAGVRRDQTRSPSGEDDSWDPVWEGRATVTEAGWFAELRIPFSQLRFSGEDAQTWGLQVERQIARNQEFAVWSFTPRDQPGGIPRFGHLEGLVGLRTGKRLEVLPYVVSRAEYVDPGANPFRSEAEYVMEGGVDLKYRVTSNLTLDATLNPDFGQVEVDPAVVNLTAFETFFPEKRPFFVEGGDIFRFGSDGTNSVFYSRRIGRRPSLLPPTPARDVPDATRILGAAKLSGRTAAGWSVGVLDAVTDRETVRFLDGVGARESMVSEPLTNYFVARARRDLRAGLSAVGGFFGAVHRDLETEPLEAGLRSAAYSTGVDWSHQWDDRTWSMEGFLSATTVLGSASAIAGAQRAPYHYFQRPDATHLDYDPARTSLSGFAGSVNAYKQVGRHWAWGGMLNTVSPGYEVSDLGFQRRADRIDAQADLSYAETRPGSVLRSYSVWGSALMEHNYGGENISNRLFPGAFVQFLNYWTVNVNVTMSLPGTVDDRLTRGGPAARRPGYTNLFARVATDPRKPVVVNTGNGYMWDEAGGWSNDLWADVAVRPAPHWELALGPSLHRSHSAAQYLQTVPDETATATYGARYVFADIDQTVLALVTRLNYTFTPGLSLQVFAQPFIATGDFGDPAEFAAPGTYDFLVYGVDRGEVVDGVIYPDGQGGDAVSFPVPQQDFNVRSLRGNAVLRWEWRPGSTLYVAWQQTREGFEPVGDFEVDRDARALFRAKSDDILLIKVNYWLNP